MSQTSPRLAVLIDADNARPSSIEPILKEVARYGTATVKRIYGDWTTPQLGGWKDRLNAHAIQPMQQFRYTTGKNATDSALIIDAMDLLYADNVEGFCLVSSDSDFTRLASRLRESGRMVYGFGERKTPEPFVRACDKFIYVELLDAEEKAADAADATARESRKEKGEGRSSGGGESRSEVSRNRKLMRLIKEAYESSADDDAWLNLGALGEQITRLDPSFDAREFGFKKLSTLVAGLDYLEVRETPQDQHRPGVRNLYVRLRG